MSLHVYRHMTSHHFLADAIRSHPTLSYHNTSQHNTSHRIASHISTSLHDTSYHIMSYHVISCHVISYIVSCRVWMSDISLSLSLFISLYMHIRTNLWYAGNKQHMDGFKLSSHNTSTIMAVTCKSPEKHIARVHPIHVVSHKHAKSPGREIRGLPSAQRNLHPLHAKSWLGPSPRVPRILCDADASRAWLL